MFGTTFEPGGGGGGIDIIPSSGFSMTVPAVSTRYLGPFDMISGFVVSGRRLPVLVPAKIKFLYAILNTPQPAGGSLVMAIYINGLISPAVMTIPANSPAGIYLDTTVSCQVVAGDFFQFGFTNNAAVASAAIGSVETLLEPQQ